LDTTPAEQIEMVLTGETGYEERGQDRRDEGEGRDVGGRWQCLLFVRSSFMFLSEA
jgi:hypothetical protein